MENTIQNMVPVETKPRKPRVGNTVITWPDKDFILKDIVSNASASTVYNRLQADIKAGKIRVSGKRTEGVGRPVLVFVKVA